jgi:hypothetical protein
MKNILVVPCKVNSMNMLTTDTYLQPPRGHSDRDRAVHQLPQQQDHGKRWLGPPNVLQVLRSWLVCGYCQRGYRLQDMFKWSLELRSWLPVLRLRRGCAVGIGRVRQIHAPLTATLRRCRAGLYSANNGGSTAKDCEQCEAGTYTATAAANVCIACEVGRWGFGYGYNCEDCTPGKYTANTGGEVRVASDSASRFRRIEPHPHAATFTLRALPRRAVH